jgi:hypothetical protein
MKRRANDAGPRAGHDRQNKQRRKAIARTFGVRAGRGFYLHFMRSSHCNLSLH